MEKKVSAVCNYCAVGCSLDYHVSDDGRLKVSGTPDYPVNKGILCPKGYKIHEPVLSPDRATKPLIRKNGSLAPATWDEALNTFTSKVREIQNKYGKKSFAFISTGQMYTEEMAMLGQVGRTGMGIEGDGNTRQCMASAVVSYKQAFGFDAPPMTYEDIEHSDCIIFVGSNAAITHAIIFNRIKKHNKNNPKIFVIDPRNSETAQKVDVHVQVKPKRDLIFLYTVANELIKRGALDHDFIEKHTSNFEEFKKHVAQYSSDNVERDTNVPKSVLMETVDAIQNSKATSIWWTMGVNQSHQGTRTGQAIINLCLMTGNIGRKGAGPCSLTGQSNAMGSRMFSNTTSLFGGRDYANPEHRKEVAEILEIDEARLPAAPTMPYHKIIDAVEAGTMKGLWIVCTNPLHSWVNTNKLRKSMEKLELIVVQDLYSNTITAQVADIFLPAAGAGEKSGFLINSERRLGIAQKAIDSPGEALSDFEIFRRVAEAYGCEDVVKGWNTPEETFQILRKLSKGMPCDFTGVKSYQDILERGGVQWPYPEENRDETQERRLFADGKFYHPDGRAKFLFENWEAPAEEPNRDYPLYLLSGRGTIVQWMSNTRTGRSAALKKVMEDEAYAEISQEDADVYSLRDGEKVELKSLHGCVQVNVKISKTVAKGYVYLPFHYETTNKLVNDAFDTYSGQPSFKTGAVSVRAV